MQRTSKYLLLGAFAASSLRGQNVRDVKLGNDFDNALVRVLEVTEEPHKPNTRPAHPLDSVLIFREAGQMTVTTGGRKDALTFTAGETRWFPAGPSYVIENISDRPIELVEVELKNTPKSPPSALSNLDMVVADSQHYKVDFENAQVRVLRVHYGAHEQGSLHEHVRPRVTVNLGDKPRARYGDVRMGEGTVTHAEQNDTDEDVERIAIELK